MKNTLTIAAAGILMILLAACSKKSSNSVSASTPTTCNYNGYQYVDQNGVVCNPSISTANNCSALGYRYVTDSTGVGHWYNQSNVDVTSQCGTNYIGTNGANGCSYWNQVYPGNYYYPMNLGNGQLVCVNSQFLQNYVPNYYNTYGSQPYNGMSQLYACNPYTCPQYYTQYYTGYGYQYYLTGNNCSPLSNNVALSFGFDSGSYLNASVCF
jgi:hypothetical protein